MNRFIKTSLAAAVLCTGSMAVAGTLSVTSQTHSSEGLDGSTATQTSNSISYTLGAAYTESDTITFTFNEDVISNTTFPSSITVSAVDSATSSDAIAGLTMGLLSTDTTSVKYRVTSISQPDDTPGDGWYCLYRQNHTGCCFDAGHRIVYSYLVEQQ